VLPGFQLEATVRADILSVLRRLPSRINSAGVQYKELDFKIVADFGATTLAAHIEWVENGITRKGPATIVPGIFSAVGSA